MKNLRWIVGSVLVALLSACGEGAPPAETAVPVLVVKPRPASGAGGQAFPGEVRARQESALSFQVGGNLLRRHVDAGQRVSKGQVLAELDVSDYALRAQAAQAQLAAAQAELERTRDDYRRYQALASEQLVSQSALQGQAAAFKAAQGQVDAARSNLDVARNQAGYAQLRAPADGVIASRQAEAGQVVAAGQTIYTLAADGGREVAIALPENAIGDFSVGQAVEVELWSAPGRRLPGSIREIAPAADAQTRTYAARVSLAAEALEAVELGQSARVHASANGKQALQLPLGAVQRSEGDQASVWVVDAKTTELKARPVRVLAYAADSATVQSGVEASDWVVAAGGHLLREGQKVTPVDRQNRPVLAPAAPAATKD